MATSSESKRVASESKTAQYSRDEILSSNEYLGLIFGMKRDLGGATYYGDKIFDDLYPPIPWQNTFCNEFIKSYPEFVFPSSPKASSCFQPLTFLLNHIRQEMKQRKLLEHSIYTEVAFEVYNKEIMDSPRKDRQMKPHVIARIPSSSQTASWEEVEFFAQVDSDFPKLVARTASYAKAIFKSQRNRLFVLGIFLDNHKHEISFGVFHAAGLIFPRKRYKLSDIQGYQEFIQTMARVYSSEQRWKAGFDEMCNNKACHISGLGTYAYVESLYCPAKVVGRRTRVDKVKLMRLSTPEVRSPNKRTLSETSSAVHNNDLQSPSKKIKSEEVYMGSLTSASIPAYLPLVPFPRTSDDAPETLILKDSWPLKSRWDIESRMFQDVQGYFGIPEVCPGYKVIHSNAEEAKTDFFSRDDLEKYSVAEYTCSNYEPRVHLRLPIVTEGVPLTEAASPRILVLGILHAMVGHWHLLKAGWLHRDVSIGNVLLRKTTIRGLKIEGLNLHENSLEYFSECTSFIVDGDLAVKWREEKDLIVSPSGTLPFMSGEMLKATAYPAVERPHTHTAVDDLESFVWVLIWTVLNFIPKDTWTALEARVHYSLNSDTARQILDKDTFLSCLKEAMGPEYEPVTCLISSGFEVFAPLLFDWLMEAKRTEMAIKKSKFGPLDQLDSYKILYQNYISLALKYIDKLPDSWDYLRRQAETSILT